MDRKLEVCVTGGENLYCLNGENGQVIWKLSGVASYPVLSDVDNDGRIEVCVNYRSRISCFRGKDRFLVWESDVGGAAPAVGDVDEDGLLEVCVVGEHKVYCLNGEDGSLLWSTDNIPLGLSIPVIADVDGDRKSEVCMEGKLCLNGEDGSILWESDIFGTTPAVGDVDGDGKHELCVTFEKNDYWRIACINGEDGTVLWNLNTGLLRGISVSPPVIGDIDGDRKLEVCAGVGTFLHCLNGEDGSVVLKEFGGSESSYPPTIGDVNGDGKIDVCWVGEKLFEVNPYFFCFTLGAPMPSTDLLPWTKLGGNLHNTHSFTLGNPKGCPKWYRDADGDGYGNPSDFTTSCEKPGGYVDNRSDCDDMNSSVTLIVWYHDSDGDGYGNPKKYKMSCEQPEGYVKNTFDCNDMSQNITFTVWWKDFDEDGYTDGTTKISCFQPEGYTYSWNVKSGDCDDSNANVNPAADEIANDKIDNDCDGQVDEPGALVWKFETGYWIDSSPAIADVDGDGWKYVWDPMIQNFTV